MGHRYSLEIPELTPSLSRHGASIGVQVFPAIKITMIHQVHIICRLRSLKINTREMPYGAQRSWTQFICVCFRVCGQQNPNTLNWSSMADVAIARMVWEFWDLLSISVGWVEIQGVKEKKINWDFGNSNHFCWFQSLTSIFGVFHLPPPTSDNRYNHWASLFETFSKPCVKI